MGDKIRMTELLWRKGQVYYSLGDYTKASALADSAADLATKLRLPIMSYLALTLKGRTQRALKEAEFASESFSKAIQEVEHLRGLIAGGEKEQQLFFEDKLTPYHEMVSLLVEQNNSIEALKYAERSKARVLLDVLRNGRVRANKTLDEKEVAEERKLYGDMVSLNAQIRVERMRQQADESRIKELDALLQKARSAYEVLQSALIAAHPEVKTRGGLLPPFAIEDLSTLVPDARTAVLEYVVTDEQTYLFVLTRDSARQKVEIKIYSVPIKSSDLSTLVGEFRKQVANNHPGFRQSGRRLYELLVKPARQDLAGRTTLCIIPDDLLWELPFQALQTDDGKYLLELSAVYYAPSLQVLSEMKKRAATLRTSAVSKIVGGRDAGFRPHFYAVGNPTISGELMARAQTVRNSPFVSLPETEKEVQTIKAEVYGPEASSTRVGSAAREEAIKAEMHRYRIIHFATHGVLDDRSPLYSYLLLARGETSSEDGLLEAWELMDMDLKAEMVVLSACDTARGSVGAGEGMIGMTWALFVAGVPTTVASHWKVPSEATTKLMVVFHKNAKKVSKAEAWRQAALEMINNPRYRMKPFYWAGFVVMGDDSR